MSSMIRKTVQLLLELDSMDIKGDNKKDPCFHSATRKH